MLATTSCLWITSPKEFASCQQQNYPLHRSHIKNIYFHVYKSLFWCRTLKCSLVIPLEKPLKVLQYVDPAMEFFPFRMYSYCRTL